MPLSTKSLEELELLAKNLREQIKRDPEYTQLELCELHDVEEWIEFRREQAEKLLKVLRAAMPGP